MNKVYIDGKEFITANALEKISFGDENCPDYIRSVYSPLSASAEMSLECEVNPRLFEKLTGVDLSGHRDLTGFTVECIAPYRVQARRHKKKRINKKWAKRYGYVTKFKKIRMTDAQFVQRGEDIEFEGRFIK